MRARVHVCVRARTHVRMCVHVCTPVCVRTLPACARIQYLYAFVSAYVRMRVRVRK